MTKGSRYPSQKLTKKEKEFIDKAFTNFTVVNTMILVKYPHPKEYAYKINYFMSLKRGKLSVLSMLFILNSLRDNVIKPELLLEYISDKLNAFQHFKLDNTNSPINTNGPNSRDLRESVLEKLEKRGYVQNFQGKENCKKYLVKHPGRKSSNECFEDNGGKRSIYKIDKRIEQFKMLMEKPVSSDYIGNKMIDNELFKRFLKYYFMVAFYRSKLDKSFLAQSYELTSYFLNKQVCQKDIEDALQNNQLIKDMDDRQIEKIAEMVVDYIKNETEFFKFWVLVHGIFKF